MSARRLVLLLALAAAVQDGGRAAAEVSRPQAAMAAGFEHLFHEGRVEVKLGEAPACAQCHQLDPRGVPRPPGHAACFAGPCHTLPKTPAASDGPVCLACHDTAAPGKKARRAPVDPASLDHGLAFPHDRHMAAAGERGCERCHAAPPAPGQATKKQAAASPVHARCAECHALSGATGAPGAAPLSDCARCHQAIAGVYVAPSMARSLFAVSAAFSHPAHLARIEGDDARPGRRCLTCHAGIATASGRDLPAPSMAQCESCHDGAGAFAALGPSCNRCHKQGEALPTSAPAQLYDHRAHQGRGAPADCAACHALDAAGAPRPASADHRPCADAACHADEFRDPAPRICGGCHIGSEPWRPLTADVPRRRATEFGVGFSHAAHLGGDHPRSSQACADCHVGLVAGPEMRLGRGHASCSGSACHQATAGAGAAPSLGDCSACHSLGLLPDRDRARDADRWSVAQSFQHARHRHDALGAPLPCTDCHRGVLAATRLSDIPTPRKAACEGCHDGVSAFKMTGHGCNRCHLHSGP